MEQPLPSSSGLYRRLFVETAKPHLIRYASVAVLLLAISGTTAAMAWVIEDVFDATFAPGGGRHLGALAIAIFAIFLVRGLATYGSAILLAQIGNQIVAHLQERLLGHLQQQNLQFFETHTLGDVAIRFSANASSARSAVELIVQSIGRDAVTLIGLTTVMVLQSPTMALTGILVLIPALLAIRLLTKRARHISKETIAANTRMIGQIREIHQGVRVIKAFTLESRIAKRMLAEVRTIRDLANHGVRYSALTAPMLDILVGALVAGVVVFAGWQITSGTASPGAIVSFLTALLLAYEPARRLARFQVQLQSHMVGVELMFDFLDQPTTEPSQAGTTDAAFSSHDIDFEAVEFQHGETAGLQGLTLNCPSGQVTALVGASGSGKSTLVDLLLRLRQPQAGVIRIGGTSIDQVPLQVLRQSIAVVPQQTFLFDASIRQNIRWGNPIATDEQIEAAARAAHAEDFILNDPEGYERVITDSAGLSGGERQRIAIARALLKDAPILVLDEATAALDPASEAAVQSALDKLMQGRTTLVIAHRLGTIRNADLIHVLDSGSVVESGTHTELMASGQAYARLLGAQTAGD